MAAKTIDISSDMGEGFGNYTLGNDEGIMKYITSANVACGFHAGDPSIMRKTVLLAKKNGVAVGAHVGLPDLLGFGRRVMEISPEDCRDYVVYQIGALRAFAEACGLKLNHATIHGALTTLVNRNEKIATAIVEAIREVDPTLYFLSRPGLLSFEIGKKLGLRVKTYAAVDLQYYRDGRFAMERQKKAVNINEVIRRAKSLLLEGRVEAVDGGYYEISPDTLLVHGDNPQAVETLQALRAELGKDGFQITHP
jgi:5-oxoprolinase (ATP-hydrolysing) subunit A